MKITTLILIAFVRISGFGQDGFTGVPISDNNPVIDRTKLTVTIGTQVWMTKNLELSTFRNGEIIPEAKTPEEWEAAGKNKQAAWCYYDNNPANGTKYGKLYNWYAVNDPRGLAPSGWYIPTDEEWRVLENSLGSEPGNKMKMAPVYGPTKISYVDEGGYYEENWIECSNCKVASAEYKKICPSCKGMGGKGVKGKYIPKTKRKVEEKGEQIAGWNGDNSSGFSALQGGCRSGYGSFTNIGLECYWWSTSELTQIDPFRGVGVNLQFNQNLHRSNGYKGCGYSVRCLENGAFGTGGTGGGTGTGNGPFHGDGNGTGETGTGTGDGPNRVRLNDPILPKYKTDIDIFVHLKLIINGDGKVVGANNITSKTTTTDQRIINGVISEVIKQVKYKEEKNAGLQFVYFTYKIRAQ
jgi:uncharacterized protein (TIGR02145 family)